ncbi:hypothetical protein AK830_g7901 [Neonectria ditissima]|uniref:Ketopantoate reductase C-terminal domain-containing protein n=1 Tax=Neonectria ditissima TaxID=78410 RepID=A0A0P7BF96_9HYPO|nr:hypothetical protein AK830_g7901 [Neonectria ditissima]
MIGSELNGCEILHNDPDKLHLAPFVNPSLPLEKQQRSCREFARIYELGGAKCAVHKDIVWHRWRKLVWNASFNPVCALVDLDSGTIQDAGCLDTLIRPAMNEVVAIAKAAGYDLPSGIQDQMVALTPKETYLKPSMQVDAQRGRPMEIEVILGNPLRVARDLLVPAPTLTTLYSLLLARQWTCNNNTGA